MFGIVVFILVFAVVILAMWLVSRVFDSQKKKRVSEMLQTAVGQQQQVETKVLIEPEKDGKSTLAQFLGGFNFVKRLEQTIQQGGLTTNVYSLMIAMVALTVPGALIGLKLNPLIYPLLSALAFALFAAMLPYFYVVRTRNKRMSAFEEQFPEALEFLARAMRAGHAFSIALEMLSEESPQPVGNEFRKVFNEHNLGLPIETALTNLTERVPLLDVRFFVSAVLLQRETGGNLAEILTKLAFVIRERFKLRGAVKSASAHGRITGTILTLMPVALMLGLLVIAPSYLQSMADDPDGRMIIASVIVMMILGHLVIRKIVDIKV